MSTDTGTGPGRAVYRFASDGSAEATGAEATGTGADTDGGAASGPGFGPALAVGALVLSGLVAARRS